MGIVNISGVGKMGVGETGVGKMGQIIGKMGVGEMGVGETGEKIRAKHASLKHNVFRSAPRIYG